MACQVLYRFRINTGMNQVLKGLGVPVSDPLSTGQRNRFQKVTVIDIYEFRV